MSDIAQIRVRLLADLADLEKMKSQANSAFRSVSTAAARESREARGSLALIGDEIGVRLPRHLQAFVAKLPGVATAMSAAFDTVAVIALIDFVIKAGEKVAEFADKHKKAAEELAKAQEAVGQAGEKAFRSLEDKALSAQIKIDELRNNHVAKLRDELELINRQSFDALESAFDVIQSKADEAFGKIKADWLSTVLSFGMGGSVAPGFQASLGRLQDQVQNQTGAGDYAGARQSILDYQGQQDAIHAAASRTLQGQYLSPADRAILAPAGITSADSGPLQSILSASSLASNAAGQMGRVLGAAWTANAKETSAKQLEDQKQQGDKAAAERGSMVMQMVKENQFSGTESDRISSEVGEYGAKLINQDYTAKVKEAADANEAWAKSVKAARTALEDNLAGIKSGASTSLDQIKYARSTGNMSAHDAALATQAVHEDEYQQSRAALLAADQKAVDVQRQLAALEAQHSAQQMEDALATRSAFDQVFDRIRQGAQDIGEKIASIMERTIDGINDQLVNSMFGEKTNYKKVFEDSEKSLAKTGLQWVEGSLLGKGKGSKGKIGDLNLSATNGALNVHIASSSAKGGSGSGASGSSDGSDDAPHSSIFRSLFPGVASLGDKFKTSPVGSWLDSNGKKYMPGAMDAVGGIMSMLQGPEHSKGEGSGVKNALADAGYGQNKLSRLLGGFGQITKGAGSMMFAGSGGFQGLNDSDAAGQMFGGKLFGAGGFFGSMQGYASGGDPVGGVPIEVGETGPEVWSPPESGGHITPNRDIDRSDSGGIHIGNIYGADPAMTRQSVAQAIAASNAHAVSKAQAKMVDRQRRVPR